MTNDLLDSLLELLEEKVTGVEFRRAWGPGWGSRLMEGTVASGEVLSRRWAGSSQETVVRLSLFGGDASRRREAAASIEEAVLAYCPGCVGLLQEEEKEDTQTRLSCLSLRMTFTGGEATSAQGMQVTLGGQAYTVAGAAVTVALSGEELTAVGEEIPFALRDAQREYQVELTGIQVQGLERMAVFTAQIGSTLYTGCRWKKLNYAQGTGVFLASGCEEQEETP